MGLAETPSAIRSHSNVFPASCSPTALTNPGTLGNSAGGELPYLTSCLRMP